MYRITYRDHEAQETRTITVKHIEDSPLGFGFIRVTGFVFNTSTLIDPRTESIQNALKGVKAKHLSLHHEVLNVDEMDESEVLELNPNRLKLIPMPTESE